LYELLSSGLHPNTIKESRLSEAARAGVSSIILDENPTLGGQIFLQPADGIRVLDHKKPGKESVGGRELVEQLAQFREKIGVWTGSLVSGCNCKKEIDDPRQARSANSTCNTKRLRSS
jgi:hypothetical protein